MAGPKIGINLIGKTRTQPRYGIWDPKHMIPIKLDRKGVPIPGAFPIGGVTPSSLPFKIRQENERDFFKGLLKGLSDGSITPERINERLQSIQTRVETGKWSFDIPLKEVSKYVTELIANPDTSEEAAKVNDILTKLKRDGLGIQRQIKAGKLDDAQTGIEALKSKAYAEALGLEAKLAEARPPVPDSKVEDVGGEAQAKAKVGGPPGPPPPMAPIKIIEALQSGKTKRAIPALEALDKRLDGKLDVGDPIDMESAVKEWGSKRKTKKLAGKILPKLEERIAEEAISLDEEEAIEILDIERPETDRDSTVIGSRETFEKLDAEAEQAEQKGDETRAVERTEDEARRLDFQADMSDSLEPYKEAGAGTEEIEGIAEIEVAQKADESDKAEEPAAQAQASQIPSEILAPLNQAVEAANQRKQELKILLNEATLRRDQVSSQLEGLQSLYNIVIASLNENKVKLGRFEDEFAEQKGIEPLEQRFEENEDLQGLDQELASLEEDLGNISNPRLQAAAEQEINRIKERIQAIQAQIQAAYQNELQEQLASDASYMFLKSEIERLEKQSKELQERWTEVSTAAEEEAANVQGISAEIERLEETRQEMYGNIEQAVTVARQGFVNATPPVAPEPVAPPPPQEPAKQAEEFVVPPPPIPEAGEKAAEPEYMSDPAVRDIVNSTLNDEDKGIELSKLMAQGNQAAAAAVEAFQSDDLEGLFGDPDEEV